MLKKVLLNAGWMTAARLFGDIAMFVFFVLLARVYGKAGVGQYASGLAIASLLFATINLNLEEFAIRESARVDIAKRRVILAGLVGGQLIIGLVVVSVTAYICLWVIDSRIFALIIACLSVYQVTLALSKSFFVPAYADENMIHPAMLELGTRILSVLSSVFLMVVVHAPLILTLVPFAAFGVVFLISGIISAHRHNGSVDISFDFRGLRSLFQQTWAFALTFAIFQLYARADIIMINSFLGEAAAGIYSTPIKMLEIANMPYVFLGVAAYPFLSATFESDHKSFATTANRLLVLSVVLGACVCWGFIFVVPAIIVPLFGQDFIESKEILHLIAVLALVGAASAVAVRLMIAANLQVFRFWIFLAGTVLNLSLNFVLIPIFGINGAIFSTVVAELMITFSFFQLLRKRLPMAVQSLDNTLVRLLFAVFTSAAVGGFMYANYSVPVTATISLLVFAIACMVSGVAKNLELSALFKK